MKRIALTLLLCASAVATIPADTALIGSGWKLIEWTTGNRSLFNLHFDIGRTKDLHAKQSLPSL